MGMSFDIVESHRGPMDPTPRITVMVNDEVFSEVRRERGWLIAEVPDEEDGYREVRGKGIRDLRVRAGALVGASS